MANNLTVTLPEYVDENRDELIARAVLGSPSAGYFNLMTGVKGPTDMHLIETDVVLQDASECGFNPEGETKISKRQLTPKYLKSQTEYCDKVLLKSCYQHEVKVRAGKVAADLPFEKEIVDGLINGIDKAIEKTIWQGDSANDNEFDGMIKILANAGVVAKDLAKGTAAYTAIKEAYMAVPEAVLEADNVVIYVSAGMFRKYIQEMVAANLYHEPAGTDTALVHKLEGTNATVKAVNGLNGGVGGKDYIVAGDARNFVIGVDLMDDKETFDIWYSKDNQTFRTDVEFVMGVDTPYPDEIAVVTIAQ